MRTITVSIPANFSFTVEVADDATDEQVKEAVLEECPKYPDIKAGTHFDPEDFEVLDDEKETT